MVGGGWVGWGALLLIASITSAFGFHNSPASSRSVAHLSHKVGTILHLEPHKSEHICPLNFAGRKCSYLAGGALQGGVFDEHMICRCKMKLYTSALKFVDRNPPFWGTWNLGEESMRLCSPAAIAGQSPRCLTPFEVQA